MARRPRKVSKDTIKAKADKAAKRSAGEDIVEPVKPIDPPIIKAAEIKAKGRPPSFKKEFVDQVKHLCKLGATDEELAKFFKVTTRTLYRWKIQYPEFCQAIKVAGKEADDRVERSLYARAVGYTYDSVKIMQHQGTVVREDYKEHVPPDTTAMIFWLKNRQPERWRDVNKTEITVKTSPAEMTDADLENIAFGSSTGVAAAPKGSQKPH